MARLRASTLLLMAALLAGCGSSRSSSQAPPVTSTVATTAAPTPPGDALQGEGFTPPSDEQQRREPEPVPLDGAQKTAVAASYLVPWYSLPPVGNQGRVGSCVAWSWAYEFATAIINQQNPAGNLDPAHQLSPLYMYAAMLAQEDGTCPGGTNPIDYVDFLEQRGGFSNALPPPYPGGTAPQPSSGGTEAEICGAVVALPSPDPAFIIAAGTLVKIADQSVPDDVVDRVKSQIAASGLPVAVGVVTPLGLHGYAGGVLETDYFERTKDLCARGFHGMLVVGWDDTLTPTPSPRAAGSSSWPSASAVASMHIGEPALNAIARLGQPRVDVLADHLRGLAIYCPQLVRAANDVFSHAA